MKCLNLQVLATFLIIVFQVIGQDNGNKIDSKLLSGMKWRLVGPATSSGRVADFAVNPNNRSEYYVAVASGGVWKTSNAGTTFKPIFDKQGSYSIGCITMDPNNPNILWVGTGENNNQRSVAYGDGIYKSEDGGKSWKHKGLKNSEHIGMIAVDPRNSNVVYAAAYGPLWSAGGDRGLYKSVNGGNDWELILEIDEHTGINEIHLDPRDPDLMYATAHQRRRHVWTYLGGGPESAIYRSKDGGQNWDKLSGGFPGGDLGRIGMDISPVNPDIIYAIVEANDKKGGFYKSSDRGASWTKASGKSTSGNYYQELICDPVNVDKIFAMDTYASVSMDGGKTFKRIGNKYRHVDDHAIWIDPENPDYYLIGGDGGVYETFDAGKNWKFMANLPVTQFYKVSTDNAEPFYNIYGGTQDNNSYGGPSRTLSSAGIINSDWFKTKGGDGFETAIDPGDPNIIYAQSQYGNLSRIDKVSGERLDIKPRSGKGEPGLRWNWDAPLIISPHKNERLYFAANILFRSDDRGNTWNAISGDLSRKMDRNSLEVMGKVWSVDAVAKNRSTSIYGNIVALTESPLQENLIYAGTDDGLIHITEDAGQSWIKQGSFPDVPEYTYVNMLVASLHDASTVYAVFNNHKKGDFKPYILKSTNKGKSWSAVQSDLPERGSVYAIAEDHVNPDLLFAGTEFGCFTSVNGGANWSQLKSGLPTVAVRDIDIQRRENDVVLGTFGRSFYVLDDYSALRHLNTDLLDKELKVFPIKDSWMYIESNPFGYSGKGFQGSAFYNAKNPAYGATFTYYQKEGYKTLKQIRQEKEKKAIKNNEPIIYPTIEELRMEDNEEAPYLLFTIADKEGNTVRRLKRKASSKGISRVTWDFRFPSTSPIRLSNQKLEYYQSRDVGYFVMPGQYQVSISKVVQGEITQLTEPESFTVKLLGINKLQATDRNELIAFQSDVAELYRAVRSVASVKAEMDKKLKSIKQAIIETPDISLDLKSSVDKIEARLKSVTIKLAGDRTLRKHQFEQAPSIAGRISSVIYGLWRTTSAPTETQKLQYEIAGEEFVPALAEIKELHALIIELDKKLDQFNAPWTPGRLPDWGKD